MYNEDKKREFINSIKDRNKDLEQNLVLWFGKSSALEEKLNTDVADFSVANIMTLYKRNIATPSFPYLRWVHSYFREYARWMNDDNHFDEVSSEMLEMCIDTDKAKSKFVLRKELYERLKEFKNAYEKVIVLGLFEGIQLSDFEKLDMSSIQGNEIHIGNRSFTISNELIKCMKSAAETFDAHGDVKDYSLDPSDQRFIKRQMNCPDADYMMRLRNIIKKALNRYGYAWISASELPQAGAVNMLLEWKAEHPEKSYKEIAEEHLSEIRERYGSYWRFTGRFLSKYEYLFV